MSEGSTVVSLTRRGAHQSAETISKAPLPEVLQQLHDKTRNDLKPLLRDFFKLADDRLFDLYSNTTSESEQNLYFGFLREIRLKSRSVEAAFEQSISAAFNNLVNPKANRAFNNKSSENWSTDGLSLVQESELEERIAVDSMISKANQAFAEQIQHLTLRIDSLVPVKVYQGNNPLRPDAICNAFVEATKKLGDEVKARLILFKLFEKSVTSKLSSFYSNANALLVEQNILPSLNIHKPSTNHHTQQPQQHQQATQDDSRLADIAEEEILPTLRGLLRGQSAGTQNTPQASSSSTTTVSHQQTDMSELMGLLTQLQQQQTQLLKAQSNSPRQPSVDVSNITDKPNVAQAEEDVINLVSMLFEFILEDRTLPAAMKALLARLQIPIIKVAVSDRAFFSQKGHPARRLLNEMASAALGWQGTHSDNDPLFKKIDSVVHTILNEFESDSSIFQQLLGDFQNFISNEKRRVDILEKRTLEAEKGRARAEQANNLIDKACEKFINGQPLPDVADKILNEGWKKVLFLILVNQGGKSDEWKDALTTARDLIWSVTAPLDRVNRQRLVKLTPDLGKRLQTGLDSIAFDPFQKKALFKELKACYVERMQSASAPAVAPEKLTPEPTPVPEQVSDADSKPDIESSPTAEQKFFLDQVDRLRPGTWFEMHESDKSFRCRLAAIIKATGKYIFVNRAGMKVAENNRAQLAQALQAGQLTKLDDGVLFDRALEAVISDLHSRRVHS